MALRVVIIIIIVILMLYLISRQSGFDINIIRLILATAEHVARKGRTRGAYRVL